MLIPVVLISSPYSNCSMAHAKVFTANWKMNTYQRERKGEKKPFKCHAALFLTSLVSVK